MDKATQSSHEDADEFQRFEEEIDVVSVSADASRMSYALPTNPSVSDRRHLQKTMQSAMTTGRRRNNNNNGLKIILPTKRPAPSATIAPAAKRRAISTNENKTNKRTRQYNRVANPTPYRRRGQYGHESESEPEPSEKRNLHNNMERQRRIDLRNAFEYLRQLVPEVLKKERAAKVVILREAAKYCDHLTYQSSSINRQLSELKNHQERLRMRVSLLRRNLALKR
ncbi:hypothetical protein WA026_022753 [Henosepilachna vigintioctopunctata]|uniref:BHLH domain-containing protein n=1 Tax=Henosepilachna vigintioctopunctata TaxID=420089 RepID=A0AAW1UGM5_9CUCU